MTCRRLRMVVLAGVTLTGMLAAPVLAQVREGASANAQLGTAAIGGVVITADDEARPLRRVALTLSGAGLSPSLLAITDDDGRFEFRELPAGRFTLTAQKTGFVRDVYGARPVGAGAGVPIAVKDGGSATITMRMTRSAAFGGRVILPPGAPISTVRLQVLKWGRVNGRRQLVSARGGAYGLEGMGEYRISGLPPGEYVLVAYTAGRPAGRVQSGEAPGAIVGLAPVYSSGTPDPSRAQPVRLAAGDERHGVDLVMDFVEMGRVSGRVIGPDGQPVPFVQVSTSQSSPINPFTTPIRTQADGSFVIPAVVPGSFTLVARGAVPGTEQSRGAFSQGPPVPLWAYESVTLTPAANVDGLVLQLRHGRSIRGRLMFGDAARSGAAPGVSGLIMTLAPDDTDTNVVGVTAIAPTADGAFEFAGVAPGRYRVQVVLPAALRGAWVVSSMSAGEVDFLDAPVVVGPDDDVTMRIELSDQPSVLAGTVADVNGQTSMEHSVVAFSASRQHWTLPSHRVVHTRTGVDGSYEIRGLPDGEYFVVAMNDLASEDLLTFEFLEGLVGAATRVAIKDRSRVTQDVRILRR